MKILYSDMLPLGVEGDKETIIDCIHNQMKVADRIEIAVGYTSNASLMELDELVNEYGISQVCLNIGMYYLEGMPEGAYHTAYRINRKWQEKQIGEIRMVKTFKYHGKLFCFYKDGRPFSAIIGSANLGVMKLEANNRRQYEISAVTSDETEVNEIAEHIEKLKSGVCSENIGEITNLNLIREENKALKGIEHVSPVPQSYVDYLERCRDFVSFFLRLKAPKYNERFMDDGRHFTKSNINVCYAAPRSGRKARDWYETQLTVGADVYHMEGYPEKNKPFWVITDDGQKFKAHTTSDNNKQFSALGDELIMGRWLKGRLVAAGIVNPVNNTAEDKERTGMITEEMLEEYGCDRLVFKKTGETELDENGELLDVWLLSFTTGKDN